MKPILLLAVLMFAMGNLGMAAAQNPSKVVTPPTAAETGRVTSEAVDKSVKDALKTEDTKKKAKKTVEEKKKMKK